MAELRDEQLCWAAVRDCSGGVQVWEEAVVQTSGVGRQQTGRGGTEETRAPSAALLTRDTCSCPAHSRAACVRALVWIVHAAVRGWLIVFESLGVRAGPTAAAVNGVRETVRRSVGLSTVE